MLVNVSYNNKEITRKVDAEVGKPFTLKERWALGRNWLHTLFTLLQKQVLKFATY